MGKYETVMQGLPKLPAGSDENGNEFGGRRERLDKIKVDINAEYGNLTASFLAGLYIDYRQQKEQKEEELKEVNELIAAVSELITVVYEEEDVTSVKTSIGKSVSVQSEPVGKVVDKQAFWKWCRENDLQEQMHLAYQTMNTLMKERLLKGEPEPEGVKAYVRDKIVLR